MAQKHDTPEYVDAPMTRAGKLELAASRRQIRSDAFTAARWAAVNPILQLGEMGYETDTNKLKVGDGVTEWNSLGYVSGSGGGDSHNKGYFATLAELQEAYPTGEAGDWAIVAESDTVYIWDDTQQAWVDTDQKGQVTSVNGQTGAVVLTIPDAVQYSTMPTASVDNLGDIVQFTGTTDANYTNGYFYKCVSDGQDPATYSWTRVDVQPTPSGLPDQTGQSGKFLTTDGTDASWSDKPLVNTATGTVYAGKPGIGICDAGSTLTVLNGVGIGNGVLVETTSPQQDLHSRSIAIGNYARASQSGRGGDTALGFNAWADGGFSIAIGHTARTSASHAIQIGCINAITVNSDANTMKVANENGNFEIMSADGTIPEARLADTTNAAQGQVLTLDSNLNAVWQASSGGGLPSQTGNAGKFLTTDGTDASWANALTNKATGNEALAVEGLASGTRSVAVSGVAYCGETVVIGVYATAYGNVGAKNNVLIGKDAQMMRAAHCIAIGWGARVSSSAATLTEHAIQLGSTGSYTYNDDSNTFKVANANGNFELMDANGNLPADRLASTTGLADGNYRLRLVMASGVPTLEWVAE